jgi:hypothetical protein
MLCSVEFDEIANNISGIYLKQIHSYVDQVFRAYEHNTRNSNDHCKYANQFIIYSYLNHTCLSQVDDLNSINIPSIKIEYACICCGIAKLKKRRIYTVVSMMA